MPELALETSYHPPQGERQSSVAVVRGHAKVGVRQTKRSGDQHGPREVRLRDRQTLEAVGQRIPEGDKPVRWFSVPPYGTNSYSEGRVSFRFASFPGDMDVGRRVWWHE